MLTGHLRLIVHRFVRVRRQGPKRRAEPLQAVRSPDDRRDRATVERLRQRVPRHVRLLSQTKTQR